MSSLYRKSYETTILSLVGSSLGNPIQSSILVEIPLIVIPGLPQGTGIVSSRSGSS